MIDIGDAACALTSGPSLMFDPLSEESSHTSFPSVPKRIFLVSSCQDKDEILRLTPIVSVSTAMTHLNLESYILMLVAAEMANLPLPPTAEEILVILDSWAFILLIGVVPANLMTLPVEDPTMRSFPIHPTRV